MDIVVCTDDSFVMPTGVMICSVCINNQEYEVTFHVVTDKVADDNKKKLEDIVSSFHGKNIAFYDIERVDTSDIPALDKDAYLTIATYYRLFLTEILPSNLKKIIYLDGDIIVRQSLKALWDIRMEDAAIAATPESHGALDSFYERLGYPKKMGYFNAGVLLINLEYWRNHHLMSVFKDFMIHHADRIVYHDQDVLNYTLRDCKIELPIKYNLQSGFLWIDKNYDRKYHQEVMGTINNPAILHFTGAQKPWHQSCRHPYRSSFFKYQAQTVWKDEPLQEDRPMSLRSKKAIGKALRKLHLIPELPPYGKGFLPGLQSLD